MNPAPAGRFALPATTPLGLTLLLTGACFAAAGELPLEARQGVCIDRPASTSPATTVAARTEIEQLLRLSDTRFLVLLRERRARVDRWADPKRIAEERRATGTTTAKLEPVEEEGTLAIVDAAGKVRQRSPAQRRAIMSNPMAVVGNGETRWARPILLAMEEGPACPYAVLTRSPASLLCYDFDLMPKSPVELPLEFVSGASVQREGDAATVRVFGRPPSSRGGEQPAIRTVTAFALHPGVGERSIEPLPVNESDLRAAVQGRAKDREGRPLTVQDHTFDVVPFSDARQPLPLRVLVRVEAERGSPANRQGMWVFFQAYLDQGGLSAPQPLPLWIEQGGSGAVIDERRATVTLPTGSQLFDVEPFSLNEGRLGLYFHFLLPETASAGGGGDNTSWIAFQFVALLTGKSLDRVLLLREDLLHDPKLTRSLETRTHGLLPILYMGRPGGARELAFRAFSFAKDKRGPSLPCAAILSLP